MALEPITRQEQIIAGKGIEPITRMERFLKEYGGGSGGGVQSNWNQNDSTKPDYVKNRTHWKDDPVETVILEEQTITFDFPNPTMVDINGTVPSGETAKVIWNGTVYNCETHSTDDGLVYFGNMSDTPFPHVGNNEPFGCIAFGTSIEVAPYNESDKDVRFGISCAKSEIHKIDSKYLPDTCVMTKYAKYNANYIDMYAVLRDYGIYIIFSDYKGETFEFPMDAEKWESLLYLFDDFNNNYTCVANGCTVGGVKSSGGTPEIYIDKYHMEYGGSLTFRNYVLSLRYDAEKSVVVVTPTLETKSIS